jgi:hypothetical protein
MELGSPSAGGALSRPLIATATTQHGSERGGGGASTPVPGGVSVRRFLLSTPVSRRPRKLYDTRRCLVCIPPITVALIGGAVTAFGMLLLLPSLPWLRSVLGLSADAGQPLLIGVAAAVIAVGLALPFVTIACW